MAMRGRNGEASISERKALDALIRHPRVTRVQLARELELTPQAVSNLMPRLSRLVRESELPTGRGGQPARAYELAVPSDLVAIGLDIGRHHIRAALCKPSGEP